jgi:RNA polymerase sigma-70 factor (ECF subfamily)
MDEGLFCEFYEQTARHLRAYVRSMVFDQALVDDLLQESYFRLLKAGLPASMDMVYRKNYLYRIATNLVRDNRRAPRLEQLSDERGLAASDEPFGKAQDVKRAFGRLKPKERELLWMAYVERFSHKEIAAVFHGKAASIRPMLARARGKFADLLKRRGYGG